jgi:hypothetical protein
LTSKRKGRGVPEKVFVTSSCNDGDDASRQSSVVSRSLASGRIDIIRIPSMDQDGHHEEQEDDDEDLSSPGGGGEERNGNRLGRTRRNRNTNTNDKAPSSENMMDSLQVLLDNAGYIEINLDRCIDEHGNDRRVAEKASQIHHRQMADEERNKDSDDVRVGVPVPVGADDAAPPPTNSSSMALFLPSVSSVSTTTDDATMTVQDEFMTPRTKRKTLRAMLASHKLSKKQQEQKQDEDYDNNNSYNNNNATGKQLKERRIFFGRRPLKKTRDNNGTTPSESTTAVSFTAVALTVSSNNHHHQRQCSSSSSSETVPSTSAPSKASPENIEELRKTTRDPSSTPMQRQQSTPHSTTTNAVGSNISSGHHKEDMGRPVESLSAGSRQTRSVSVGSKEEAAEVVQALAAVATGTAVLRARKLPGGLHQVGVDSSYVASDGLPVSPGTDSTMVVCRHRHHHHHGLSKANTENHDTPLKKGTPPTPTQLVQQGSTGEATLTSTMAVKTKQRKKMATQDDESDDEEVEEDRTRRYRNIVTLTPSEYMSDLETRETVACGMMQSASKRSLMASGTKLRFQDTRQQKEVAKLNVQEPDSTAISVTLGGNDNTTIDPKTITTLDSPSGWSFLQCGGLSFWGRGKIQDYMPKDDIFITRNPNAGTTTMPEKPQQPQQHAPAPRLGTTNDDKPQVQEQDQGSPSSSKENLCPGGETKQAPATSPKFKEGQASENSATPKAASSADVNSDDSASPIRTCAFHDHPPLSSTLWPQAPILLRPTPNSGTRIRGIRWDKSKSGDYLWDPSMERSWTECLRDHWESQGQKSTCNTAGDPTLGPLAPCCEECAVLPINNGNEPRGESLVVDFETELFVGSLMLRIRASRGTTCNPSPTGKPEEDEFGNEGFFANRALRFQAVIRGNFTKSASWKDFLAGYQLERPCGSLPPKWVIWSGLKVLAFFAPQLSARFDGDRPYTFTPLGSTPRVVVVEDSAKDYMGDLREEPTMKETSLVGKAFPIDNALNRARARKKAFDHWYTNPKSKPHNVDPNKTYTFEFLQHLFDYRTFTVDLGSMIGSLNISDSLNGQAMQIMACHDETRKALWSFDLWNESLLKDAQKHYGATTTTTNTTSHSDRTMTSSSTTKGVRARSAGKGGKKKNSV